MGTHAAPPPLKGHCPQFSANVRCGQTAEWIPLGMEVGLGPGDFVLDGDPSTPEKGQTHSTQFFAHVYCGHTAGWIKMQLDTEVNVGSGVVVLDGVAAPPKRGTAPLPIFSSCLLWPNGWMDEDATWYGSRPRPRPHCIRRGPSSSRKGHSGPPLFSAHVYCGHGRPCELLLSSCL